MMGPMGLMGLVHKCPLSHLSHRSHLSHPSHRPQSIHRFSSRRIQEHLLQSLQSRAGGEDFHVVANELGDQGCGIGFVDRREEAVVIFFELNAPLREDTAGPVDVTDVELHGPLAGDEVPNRSGTQDPAAVNDRDAVARLLDLRSR